MARGARVTTLKSPRATVPPAQQKPIPHLVLCAGEVCPFMPSGQHSSIDMSELSPICMLVLTSSDDITTPPADAPIGSIISERAIANAMMVRTSRIEIESTFMTRIPPFG